MQNYIHYLNDEWVKTKDLKISVFDISVLRGYGVFDFLRTYNKKPFELEKHLDRFFNSVSGLDLSIKKTRDEVRRLIMEGIRRNKGELNIRIVLTGGVSADNFLPSDNNNFIIMFTHPHTYPNKFYSQGIAIKTVQYARLFPQIKSLDYVFGVYVLKNAKKQGYVEVLYLDNDRVLEPTTSNIFFVKDNELFTPATDILPGVTKYVVINIARQLGIKVNKVEVKASEMGQYDEIFLTATNKEIMPVIKINKTIVGNGEVGPVTRKLTTRFREITHGL